MSQQKLQNIWQSHLEQAVQQQLTGTTLSAFNPNVDVVLRIDGDSIKKLMERNPDLDLEKVQSISLSTLEAVNSREEFLAVLIDRLQAGKSLLMVGENPELFGWLEEQFSARQDKLGGQAGIMATQLAALNARSVLYSPILSTKQAEVLDPSIKFPVVVDGKLELKPVREAARPEDPTRSPWVFEYGKGEEFDFGFKKIVTPRANRVIIVSRIQGLGMNFREDFYPQLPGLAKLVDVGMVAGYHLGGPDPNSKQVMRQYFRDSARALNIMREANPELRLHLEYVPMKEADMEGEMLRTITAAVNSFGINETEIRHVLTLFGYEELGEAIEKNERAYSLYQGGLALLREFGVDRVHIHNLGYYVLILKKPYSVALERVRQACLYGSSVNANRALSGNCTSAERVLDMVRWPVSETGLEQLMQFASEVSGGDLETAKRISETGIAEFADHYVLVVPVHIIPNPVITVGMGDTISSSSYAMEVIGTMPGTHSEGA